MNVVNHNCPTCGAILNFNPNTQSWNCRYCKINYTLDMLNDNVKKYNKSSIGELNEIECNNCGAKVITDSSTSSTICKYCNSSVIIKKRLIDEYKPDYIIPFKNTKEKIIDVFFNHLNSKILCPKKFKNKSNIKSITGLYVPFWLVSTDVLASIKGDMYNENHYHYSEFKRVGEMKLDRVPFDGKSNLDNEMLKGILPFDYKNAKKFEYPYLAGFYAEVFDENQNLIYENQIKDTIREVSIKKLTSTVPNFIEGEFGKIEKVNFYADNFKYEYVLVPVWFIKMEFDGSIYEYCVNDSNFNISGKYPLNKYNCFMLYALDFFVSILLCCLISFVDQSLGITIGLALFFMLLPIIDYKIKEYDKIRIRKSSVEYIIEDSFKIISE